MPDFFYPADTACTISSARCAYLYDSNGTAPAVLSEQILSGCPVMIDNPGARQYVFRPIDKVVYGPMDGKRGDVFLHTPDRLELIFAELKLWHVPGWFKAGVAQLKCVIRDFISAHRSTLEASRIRKAYVCNPYRAKFAYSYAEEIRDFRRETRFVLYPEGRIRI